MSIDEARRWRYHAANAAGVDVAGEIEAASERDAVDALRRRALWVTTITPIGGSAVANESGKPGAISAQSFTALRARLSALFADSTDASLAVTIRAMSSLLGAGVPLDQALAYAAGESRAVAGSIARAVAEQPGAWEHAFASVRNAVRSGDALSTAVAREPRFPVVFAPTLAAAEASGTLGTALGTLADHLDRASALRARLRAALAYPALLGVASVLAIVVIMLVVVPRFAALVADSGGTLPWSTRALVAASSLLARWWWLIAAVLLAMTAAVRQWLADPAHRARWHRARVGWPVIGHLERTRAAAAYTGVLAVALRAGVPLLQAMTLARRTVRNVATGDRLAEAEQRVRSGGAVAAALDGILPPLCVRLLDAGEAGGELAAMAERASDAADAELQRVANGAVTLVEPALILAFGALVGFVALALLHAIYGLNARSLYASFMHQDAVRTQFRRRPVLSQKPAEGCRQ